MRQAARQVLCRPHKIKIPLDVQQDRPLEERTQRLLQNQRYVLGLSASSSQSILQWGLGMRNYGRPELLRSASRYVRSRPIPSCVLI